MTHPDTRRDVFLCGKRGCDRTASDPAHRPMSACPYLGMKRDETPSGDLARCPWPKEHHDPATGKAFGP